MLKTQKKNHSYNVYNMFTSYELKTRSKLFVWVCNDSGRVDLNNDCQNHSTCLNQAIFTTGISTNIQILM